MLTAHHISKTYNLKTILSDVSFSLNPGERIGLVGPNGSGKTTLMRILARIEEPDDGFVSLSPRNVRVAYLPQGFEFRARARLADILSEYIPDLERLGDEIAQLAQAISASPERKDLQESYDLALSRLERSDPSLIAQSQMIVETLGLASLHEETLVDNLSGGQKTRLALARVLLERPQIVLLDEPTNHLDIEMLEWLESWLTTYTQENQAAVLIVSHDRTFLDHTTTQTLYLDPESHAVRAYAGNYSEFVEQYLAEIEGQWAAYRDQEYEIRRMRQDINRTKQQSLNVELTTTSRQPGVRRYAKKVAKKAKSREKKLERYLESDERIEKPRQSWQMKLAFDQPEHLGKDALRLEGLQVGYPQGPVLLQIPRADIRAGERVVLTGPNGTGKTTLLRTIAGVIQAQAGEVRLGSSTRMGYMTQEQESLDPEASALEIIQAVAPFNETESRSFLHFYLFSGDDPLRAAKTLSYGERSRLSLARLVASGSNFLLLDEPINHLDIPSRERFEQALKNFEGTILAVVHDRYFIDRFATQIWKVEAHTIRTTPRLTDL